MTPARRVDALSPTGQHRVMLRRVIGVVLVLVGGVWFFQGIGVIGGSFMTDNSVWVAIGAVVAIVGFVLIWPRRASR
jgi:hypothetical protein